LTSASVDRLLPRERDSVAKVGANWKFGWWYAVPPPDRSGRGDPH
jgi:hypothetical protein